MAGWCGALALLLLFLGPPTEAAVLDGTRLIAAFPEVTPLAWQAGTDPCMNPVWQGVVCISGQVRILDLAGLGLLGEVNWANLSSFNFESFIANFPANNGLLSGEVDWNVVGGWTDLETFTLAGNRFSGPINLAPLSSCTRLVILRIKNCLFSGPLTFPEALTAVTVDLQSNFLSGALDFSPLSTWTSLQSLQLQNNSFSGPPPSFASLPSSVTYLLLHRNAIFDGRVDLRFWQLPPRLTSFFAMPRLDVEFCFESLFNVTAATKVTSSDMFVWQIEPKLCPRWPLSWELPLAATRFHFVPLDINTTTLLVALDSAAPLGTQISTSHHGTLRNSAPIERVTVNLTISTAKPFTGPVELLFSAKSPDPGVGGDVLCVTSQM